MVRSSGIGRIARIVAVVMLMAGLMWATIAPQARAEDKLASYNADVRVNDDGTLEIKATLKFDGAASSTLTQRFANRETILDNKQRVYEVKDFTAKAGDNDLSPSVSEQGDYTVLSIDPKGATEIVITYKAIGAAIAEADGSTTVAWRVLQGLSVPVDQVQITMSAAAQIMEINCVSGPPSAPGVCRMFSGGTHDNQTPTFTDGPRGAGEIVQPSVRYPQNAVKANERTIELWSLDRAFRPGPAELLTALGLLVLGAAALYAAHRKIGRDAVSMDDPTLVASFKPVGAGESVFEVNDSVRPGHVGTVVDERVDPVDITASILDLAARGHLRITELPRPSEYAPTDWQFSRLENTTDELAPYEQTLLDALAPNGDNVKVSEIGPAVQAVIPQVQSELYDDVVARGWFAKRPDDTRNTWGRIGWVALAIAIIATVLLVAFTTFGLAGLILIALALGLVFVAQEMPARTAQGTSVLAGMMALRSDLLSHPTDEMPAGEEYRELSEILPYAVVLGGQDRWLSALVAADDDEGVADPTDLNWYHAPDTWHLQDLPDSMQNFITTVEGNLFRR